MHPNKAFDWTDQAAMMRFAGERSFAHIFAASPDSLFVVHAPILVTGEGRIQFHVARRNRIAGQLPNGRVLISLSGRDAFHSANWYASDDQVPTWHYETVEIEGVVRQLSDEALVEMLDVLSDRFERQYSPDQPWTRGKMTPGRFEAMLRAIVGFEVDPLEVRGTRKFNQHKGADDREANLRGQRSAGRDDIVSAIQEVSNHDQ